MDQAKNRCATCEQQRIAAERMGLFGYARCSSCVARDQAYETIDAPVWPSTADAKADRERVAVRERSPSADWWLSPNMDTRWMDTEPPAAEHNATLALEPVVAADGTPAEPSMFKPIYVTPENCGVRRPSCASCRSELIYSARARGDGLCGPCSRKTAALSVVRSIAIDASAQPEAVSDYEQLYSQRMAAAAETWTASNASVAGEFGLKRVTGRDLLNSAMMYMATQFRDVHDPDKATGYTLAALADLTGTSSAPGETDEQLKARRTELLAPADPALLLRSIAEATGSGLDYIGDLLGDRRKATVTITPGVDDLGAVATFSSVESDADYRERLIDRTCTCRGGVHVLGRDSTHWPMCQCKAAVQPALTLEQLYPVAAPHLRDLRDGSLPMQRRRAAADWLCEYGFDQHALFKDEAALQRAYSAPPLRLYDIARPQQVCHFCERPGSLSEYTMYAYSFVRGEHMEIFYACELACANAARNRCDNSRREHEARQTARKEAAAESMSRFDLVSQIEQSGHIDRAQAARLLDVPAVPDDMRAPIQPLRPDGFSQQQVDKAKAVLLSTVKRGAK